MIRRLFLFICAILLSASMSAQGVKPLPTLHVEGRWLCDSHGNHVVLHGVMDTPNAWFNGGRWGWDYSTVTPCLNYFEKLFAGMEKSKCTIFRLHLDPAWTNDPNDSYRYSGAADQPSDASGEADISKFNPTRLKTYLSSLYWPLIQKAMNHGMYVVVRPPGVCPASLKVGDYYNQYLMTVWDLVTQNAYVRKYAGQVSIELANEPISIKNANGEDDDKACHDFFQPIVDKIRANGFTGIIWVPGTGWQANYTSYATNPIEGYNIGYAVHDYPGWYGCSDSNPDPEAKIAQFHKQVPVVDTNPIFISEVDWSPENPDGEGHYDEHGNWVVPNLGTWGTGSTSKYGKAFKACHDYYGNISMTLTHPHEFFDIDQLLKDGTVVPAFNGNPEACAKACMDWYADYYNVNWAHADYKNKFVSDQGNGKYKNPIIFADVPDPDVIRVDDTYYMISTTMHLFPGATIMKSKDLINWEYCAQPLEKLSTKDRYNLLNGEHAYGSGMWACSMKYHNGKFYILINGNDAGGFVLSASDPEGKWEMKQLSRIYYDPGMLFDNGKVYVACGIGNIQMCELDEDFNYIQEKNVISNKDGLEGSHLYKIGDYYYIYATYGGWPSGQAAFRSKNIFGPYEEKMLVEKIINNSPNTIHQGALVETTTGQWWTILQQDLGAFGRMPNLQPVKWVDDWPIVGNNGIPYTTYTKPNIGSSSPIMALPTNNNFRSYPIGMQWEWNHNPDNGAWSLFERPGWLRLKTSGAADRLTQARNMLTQRIFALHDKSSQASTGTIRLDVSHLKEGDRAGICILQDPYAAIAVEVKDGKRQLVWWQDQLTTNDDFTPKAVNGSSVEIDSVIYLRAAITYGTSKTQFSYSLDNKTFTNLGEQTTLKFNLSVFVGARFGLFCYHSGVQESGSSEAQETGYADFDWFSTEASFDEKNYFPEHFEGYSAEMLTVEKLELASNELEIMVGNSTPLQLTATFRDGHTEDVAAKAKYTTNAESIVKIQGGQLRGMGEGIANVYATFTDPMGNTLSTTFKVKSTFFPFAAQYINTNLFGEGTYNEKNHAFRPSQWGQMGWEYSNGADMSGYKYLVIKLKQAQTCGAHLNIFTTNSIWGDCCASEDFGTKNQIVVNLQTAKYTSGGKSGNALETNNIRIVCFWGNGNGIIVVDDMYLTNNSDYSREETSIALPFAPVNATAVKVYNLSGQLLRQTTSSQQATQGLPAGIYIVDGKKVIVK
ncbi:MAG: family 43 glycosylhydrolase [Prevotella sp.]|nr:family 43 glycosylhydrolase [Prevotella sp.]